MKIFCGFGPLTAAITADQMQYHAIILVHHAEDALGKAFDVCQECLIVVHDTHVHTVEVRAEHSVHDAHFRVQSDGSGTQYAVHFDQCVVHEDLESGRRVTFAD